MIYQLYEISHDMGDDVQLSAAAMYLDKLPQRHRIAEIDDESSRSISRWMHEEDCRECDTFPDPLEETVTYFGED
ncbi:hypothetical protein [Nonomuraea rhizosphaerae]|uniref:hypothetical protein n=1 Tax=Nonomuraea rhizosphaerae TaxID=2665663 RepID=UPI001C5E4122|nr:hypothetical protein [Nonomuraea rhizosphaerae]